MKERGEMLTPIFSSVLYLTGHAAEQAAPRQSELCIVCPHHVCWGCGAFIFLLCGACCIFAVAVDLLWLPLAVYSLM